MNGYTKLFQSLVTSSLWTESDRTRIVWITLLAMADKYGEIQASIPGLARIAGVPLEDCEKAIELFLAPDKHSRTEDFEGRRIEKIDGGWALLNHAKYRRMASDIDRREKAAERKRRQRNRDESRHVTPCHASVTHGPVSVTPECAIAEAEAEAEAEMQSNSIPINPLFAASQAPEASAGASLVQKEISAVMVCHEASKTPEDGKAAQFEAFRIRVGLMLRRRPTTRWSDKELKALAAVVKLQTPEEDIALLEKRYASNEPYLRKDILSLLNHWGGEIDKATNQTRVVQTASPRLIGTNTPDDSGF